MEEAFGKNIVINRAYRGKWRSCIVGLGLATVDEPPFSLKGFRYICKNTLIMNALRQYTTSQDGTIRLKVPAEYMHRRLEVIILPVDDASRPMPESEEQLREAHRIIDEGGGIEDPDTFLAEFERSRQDRSMPNRD